MESGTGSEQEINEQALFDALDALQPSKLDRRKLAFEKAYTRILDKLAQGIKEGDIVKALSSQGVLKSRNTYVKWMSEMKAKQEADIKPASVVREAILLSAAARQA